MLCGSSRTPLKMCSVRHARARGERVFPRGVSPLMNDRAPPINGVERGSGSSRGGKAPYKRRARNLIARLFELASTRKTGQPCGLRSIANGAKDRPTQALPEEHARQATTLEESQTTRGADTIQVFSNVGGGALLHYAVCASACCSNSFSLCWALHNSDLSLLVFASTFGHASCSVAANSPVC